jgi:hypothetical protein
MFWVLASEEDILEYVCAESNKDTGHLVGK